MNSFLQIKDHFDTAFELRFIIIEDCLFTFVRDYSSKAFIVSY